MLRFFERYQAYALLALRLVVGVIFIYHGYQKIALWGAEPSARMGEAMLYLMRFFSIAEPLGGVALIVGFLTRWAALGFVPIMLGAMYLKMFFWGVGFSSRQAGGWEFDLVLLAGCLVLLTFGAGRLALRRT